MLMRIVTDN